MAGKNETSFVKAWLKDLSEEVDDRWYRIIPIWFGIFFAIGSAVAFYLPEGFWDPSRDTATIVYTGILTFNGILLALSWSAFSKIYELIGAGNFSAFLLQNKVLNSYLFAVRYVQASQMVAMVVSIASLLFLQFPDFDLIWKRIACALMLGFSAYAIRQASMAVGIMQDLVQSRAQFDASEAARRNGLRAA